MTRKWLSDSVYREGRLNAIAEIVGKYKRIANAEIAVGFPLSLRAKSAAKEPNGASVVDVAIWNNFGTNAIPERRFMDEAARRMPRELAEIKKKICKAIIDGRSDEQQGLEILGVKCEVIIKKVITEWKEPPNSPLTVNGGWITTKTGKRVYIKGKKDNNPLVDTGLMRNMVTSEIREKRG